MVSRLVVTVALVAGAALALLSDGRFELIDGFLYDASLAGVRAVR
jgi:hypothetical protein